MRFGLTLGVAAALAAAGCVDFPVDDWRVERRVGVQYPVPTQRDADGAEREVIYLPQGSTSFHIDYTDPYPYYYAPGYVTYTTPGPVYYGGGYPALGVPYGTPYATPYPTNDRGPVYVPYGYAGGVLAPGSYPQQAGAGGGSKYYPGSGAWTQPGQSRESYGLYGNGNQR